MPNISDNTFVFLSTMWWQERKNPEGLIKAYLSEFNKDNDDVILILVALSYNTNWVASRINEIKSQVRKMSLHPRIGLISHTLEERTLWSLMNRCDCYVSLHRGEGFGLPIAECGGLGKIVIATNYGGVLEYLKDENSYLVEYHLDPVFMNYSYYLSLSQ